MSNYSAFHIRDARSLRLIYLPTPSSLSTASEEENVSVFLSVNTLPFRNVSKLSNKGSSCMAVELSFKKDHCFDSLEDDVVTVIAVEEDL